MIDGLLDKLAPHHCFGCGVVGSVLCDCCKDYVLDESFSRCILCVQPVGGDNLCSGHRLPYRRGWCVASREGAIARVIDAYKFERVQAACFVLADLLDSSLPDLPTETVLVPVPATSNSLRVRGYDHMLLICQQLSRARGWKVTYALKRNNNITQHFAKSAAERREQAKTFFSSNGTMDTGVPHLVVDDIFTTGATVEAAARCLVGTGVTDVWVATLARQTNN